MIKSHYIASSSHIALLALLGLAFPISVAAQEAPDPPQASDVDSQRSEKADEPEDDFHARRLEDGGMIVVTAAGLRQLDVLAGTSILEGVELQRNLDGQLGEVLARLPGVSATSFSPGASRPVLRGFGGERVKVLVDGLGAIDVSNTSADHAVSIDPLNAERIEVLRGPAVMLYGSQAIGGAVNVIDKRIPQRMPEEPVHVDALISGNSAANLRAGGASIDAPIGENLAFHIDGSYRETVDLEVPGFVVAAPLRSQLLAQADTLPVDEAASLREAALQSDVLPNSATRSWSANAGFALFAGESDLGVAFGVYDTEYGVPTLPGGGEDEGVSIGLRQYRADLRSRLALDGGSGDGPFEQLRTRIGYSNYTHTEFEGDEIGTVFDVKGIEARSELVQRERGGWGGSLGVQYTFRDFASFGEEAYVADNRTDQYAIFALQEYGPGPVQLEGAVRYEVTDVAAQPLGLARNFHALSGALSLAYETDEALRSGVNISRAERAPSAEELYSNGAHVATQAFEIGNPDLTSEVALGVEAFLRGRIGMIETSVAIYHSSFDDYIYLSETGGVEDGLPVFAYLQRDARYTGIEGELSFPLFNSGLVDLVADLRGDYVRARLDDGTPLPRIPPLTLLGALEAQTERFDGRVEVQYSSKQNRVAAFETPTAAFTFVNASIAWKPLRGQSNVTVLLQADNIFDVTGRRHASFTKDFVPLAGRNFKLSVRASF